MFSFKSFSRLGANLKSLNNLINHKNVSTSLNRFQSLSAIPKYNQKKNIVSDVLASEEDTRIFDAAFTDVVEDLTGSNIFGALDGVSERIKKALYYNVPKGKKARGLTVLTSYKMLEKPHLLTDEGIHKACIMGWAIELLQTYLLIIDDIMDDSETRRGQKCWYRVDDIGLTGINDAIFFEQAVYVLLKKYFSNHNCYVHFVDNFHDSTLNTIYGQFLDTSNVSMENFNMNRYDTIITFKTSYYSFVLPFKLALYMTNQTDEEVHSRSQAILLKIGHIFQVQDDYLDCFGDADKTGKLGTDIESNKCSWMINKALQLANPEQLKILKECYGKNDPECVNIVKKIYVDLELPRHFIDYQEKIYQSIRSDIKQSENFMKTDVFKKLSAALFKREC